MVPSVFRARLNGSCPVCLESIFIGDIVRSTDDGCVHEECT